MGLLGGASRVQHLAQALSGNDDLKDIARSAVLSALAAEHNPNGASAPKRKVSKPALLVAGGAAGLTAASAAVSAYRRSRSDA